MPLASERHQTFGRHLAAAGYHGWRSVEMRAADDWQQAIRDAADLMAASYS